MTMTISNLLVPGSKYRFFNLMGEDGERTITILSISVSGNVCFGIELDDEPGRSLHDVPIERVSILIENGFWRPAD